MTKHLTSYLLIFAAIACGNIATAAPISSVEQVLNAVPPAILRKLSNKKTMAEGQAEINKHFGANVINQRALLQAQIDFAEATPDGRNKYRIRATNVPVKWKGGKMDRLVWFYFPAANIPPEGSATTGSEITVSGVVRRCEVVTVNESLRINFDLVESKLEQAAR